MKTLFTKQMNKKMILPSIALLALGFYLLISEILPVIGIFSIATAGLISLYLLFGSDGIKKTFSKPQHFVKNYFIFLPISYLFSGAGILIVKGILHLNTAVNPVGDIMSWTMLPQTLPMLLGEELITFVLLLIIANLLGGTRKAIVIGVIISSVVFGLLHLSTYDWNIAQCLIMIGITRIPFTIASLKSDSLWTGFAIHVTFDWAIFLLILLTR